MKSGITIYRVSKKQETPKERYRFGEIEIESEGVMKRIEKYEKKQEADPFYRPIASLKGAIQGIKYNTKQVDKAVAIIIAAHSRETYEIASSPFFGEFISYSELGLDAITAIEAVRKDSGCTYEIKEIAGEAIKMISGPIEESARLQREVATRFNEDFKDGFTIVTTSFPPPEQK